MFVPGHNEKLLLKAAESDADALILDLEDSVTPFHNKIAARKLCAMLVQMRKFSGFSVWIRVNDKDSGLLEDDIKSFIMPYVDGFIYPKSYDSEDIINVDKLIQKYEEHACFKAGHFKLIPLIETCSAVINAYQIATASQRVIALAFGCEDFVADLQGVHDERHLSLYTPRAMIAMACRAAGKIPVDTVHIKVHDLNDLEENLKVAKTLGFEGMLILNPKEIPLAKHYFTPTPQEVADAKKMLKLAEEAEKSEKGVAYLDDRFVGPPMVLAAKKLLKKYDDIEKFEESRKSEREK